jgi:hypothetical protein
MIRCFFGLSILLLSMTSFGQSLCVDWPKSTFQPIPNSKTAKIAPDYGLYWFKHQEGKDKVMRAFTPPSLAHQFSNGQINRLPKNKTLNETRTEYMKRLKHEGFFDPKKPTLIFIHGDQPNMTKKHKRMDFCYSHIKSSEKKLSVINTKIAWHKWNVAIFYWNQFADDVQGKSLSDFVKAITYPEMKIYSSKNKAGMRWAYLDKHNKVRFCSAKKKHCIALPRSPSGEIYSVRMLAYHAFLNAFPKGYSKEIRITGQSLGAQVAIQLTALTMNNPHAPHPSQLVLLDPYFTPGIHHIYDGQDTDSVGDYNYRTASWFLKRHPELGFVIYRTTKLSEWPTGDRNKRLEDLSAYLRICPAYLKNTPKKQQQVMEHISCGYIYFHSKQFHAPKDYINASSSSDEIHQLMGKKRYCVINDFNEGCQYVSSRPIRCPIEGFFKIH